ncbi:hypothetical protein CDAR_548331 [Caerostris darwini]|uniref:Uncharacterized protein n=1 Tax=Caerostris darwini TaxID=1538125 RepID=A0AAV4TJK4_9ARAC|nr:hypothetical protein CDAR_548331 [Caerostris darwini]
MNQIRLESIHVQRSKIKHSSVDTTQEGELDLDFHRELKISTERRGGRGGVNSFSRPRGLNFRLRQIWNYLSKKEIFQKWKIYEKEIRKIGEKIDVIRTKE